MTLAVSTAKLVAKPAVLPARGRTRGFNSRPPLDKFVRVTKKSAVAAAPVAVNRMKFSRSQKGCSGRMFSGAFTTTTGDAKNGAGVIAASCIRKSGTGADGKETK